MYKTEFWATLILAQMCFIAGASKVGLFWLAIWAVFMIAWGVSSIINYFKEKKTKKEQDELDSLREQFMKSIELENEKITPYPIGFKVNKEIPKLKRLKVKHK